MGSRRWVRLRTTSRNSCDVGTGAISVQVYGSKGGRRGQHEPPHRRSKEDVGRRTPMLSTYIPSSWRSATGESGREAYRRDGGRDEDCTLGQRSIDVVSTTVLLPVISRPSAESQRNCGVRSKILGGSSVPVSAERRTEKGKDGPSKSAALSFLHRQKHIRTFESDSLCRTCLGRPLKTVVKVVIIA